MGESSVMRALVVHQPGGPEAMRLQQLPAPQPGPHQVVIAVEAVGVNPVDAGNRADPSWAGVNPPYVVGYELAGRIQAAGDEAGWRPGELVWGLLPVRGTRWGTYAELVTLDAALVAPRPPSLSAVQAASLPLAGATAVQLLDRLEDAFTRHLPGRSAHPARPPAPFRRMAGRAASHRWEETGSSALQEPQFAGPGNRLA
jgi:NADPH:quinone reductase-like Zn-dependent oxidoreductase